MHTIKDSQPKWYQILKVWLESKLIIKGNEAKDNTTNESAWWKPNLVDWRSHGLSSIGKLVGHDSKKLTHYIPHSYDGGSVLSAEVLGYIFILNDSDIL